MRDHELYARILGIQLPWRVHNVELHLEAGEVHVGVVRALGWLGLISTWAWIAWRGYRDRNGAAPVTRGGRG